MSRPRVLVTGAGGFIGSNMVQFLRNRGLWVRAVDKVFPDFREPLWSQATERVQLDLSKPSAGLETALREITWVFHFAADMGGVGYFHSEADQLAARNNMHIDLNVLRACEDAGVERLFYSSSVCSYPTAFSDPTSPLQRALRETDWGNGFADALYGEEKRMTTLLLGKSAFARVGFLDTVYGPYQEYEGERMKFPTAITRKVIEAFDRGSAASAAEDRTYDVEIWGDGTQVRHVLFVDDALEKFWRVIAADTYSGPVNIASDQSVTVRECADYVCEHLGITPRYIYRPDKPVGVMMRRTDNRAFDDRYGAFTQTPPRVGFVRLAEWMRTVIDAPGSGGARQLHDHQTTATHAAR